MTFKMNLFVLIFLSACTHTTVGRLLEPNFADSLRLLHEGTAKKWMVASQGEHTTAAALDMFERGGNIIDAFAAASFSISVERPHSTGLGGGGFLLYRNGADSKIRAFDFREQAPQKSGEKMFQNKRGEIVPDLSTEGILAAGVPGMVRGVLDIHKKFGKLPRKVGMAPAIKLAAKGFIVNEELAEDFKESESFLAKFPETFKTFSDAEGSLLKKGDLLVQPALAQSLRAIAQRGPNAFYQGEIAKALLLQQSQSGGLISAQDLANYSPKQREPIRGKYRDYTIVGMPPPSSGGILVQQILNIVENAKLHESDPYSATAVLLTAGAMRAAFEDRAKFLGDSEYVPVPIQKLTSKKLAREKYLKISLGIPPEESTQTTHFSIMDASGSVVSSTQTINGFFGSGVMIPGTGILLNNEMDDFSAKPGAPNMYGAIGANANAISGGKRPLSSMSPTIVEQNGKVVLTLGSPGGTRIVSCVALVALNYLEHKMNLWDSVAALRYHDQASPKWLEVEKPGFSSQTLAYLKAANIEVKEVIPMCRVQAIATDPVSGLIGVSDPRGAGQARGP